MPKAERACLGADEHKMYHLAVERFGDDKVQQIRDMKKDAVQKRFMNHLVPRLQLVFHKEGKHYAFGGAPTSTKGFPDVVQELADVLDAGNAHICVINYYENGSNSIAWHTDAEKGIDPTRVVSVSIDAGRTFWVRSAEPEGRRKCSFFLEHRDVFEMLGDFQARYQHAVLKEPHLEGQRINITFRFPAPKN